MRTSEFDYNLPKKLIAQEPVRPRDHSRLMVLDRQKRSIKHRHFFDIGEFLKKGDLLVLNDTKVFKARLEAKVGEAEVEIFLLRPMGKAWQTMAKPGRKLKEDKEIVLKGGLKARLIEKKQDGTYIIQFKVDNEKLFKIIEKIGHVPVPPYVEKEPERPEDYQTVYAEHTGSVAAPTAGFHFTKELIEKLKRKGVEFKYITLHVGIGTFQPVKTEEIEDHKMHSEFVSISEQAAEDINKAKEEGRRVISAGTTTCRALEGVAGKHGGKLKEYSGDVNIFMYPGYVFKIVDGLITNFHLPRSTLLMLASALAGRELVMKAYDMAVKEEYRFYSFGDAMLVL